MADRTETTTRTTATEIPAVPPVRRTSWGAIIAGTIIAMMLQLHFAILGLAIGLTTVNPAREAEPYAGLGVGATIWWIITGIISLFIGGWIAGRLAGVPRKLESALHGFGVWALTMLLTAYLLTSTVGSVIGGAMGVLRTGTQVAGQAAPEMTEPGGPVGQQDVREFRETARREAREFQEDVGRAFGTPETQERAVNIAAATAWGIVIMQLLALAAALIGGAAGTPEKHYVVDQSRTVTTAGR